MRLNRINRPKSPQLDMNPMVDMAFLLVTFFLLATTFKVPEPASVVLPRAVVIEKVPDDKLITITITNDGRNFLSISDNEVKATWLKSFASSYDLKLDSAQIEVFVKLSGFGLEAKQLIEYLSMDREKRKQIQQEGIPSDSLNNQLAEWLILANTILPGARIAIKSDRNTPYKYIDRVIQTLIGNKFLRFNLLTEIRKNDD